MYKYLFFFLVCVQMYAAVNKELCEKMMNELEGMLSLQFEMNNTPLKWRNIAWGRPEEISLQVTHE
jgi:hypothetical protein